MKQDEYSNLLEELEDIKASWESKDKLSILDYIKFWFRYWRFNRKVRRYR